MKTNILAMWRGMLCAGLVLALGACGGKVAGEDRGDDHPSEDTHPTTPPNQGSTGPQRAKPGLPGSSRVPDTRAPNGGPISWTPGGGTTPGDGAAPGGDGTTPSDGTPPGDGTWDDGNSGGPDDGSYECKEPEIKAIALEGDKAPRTYGQRFDAISPVDETQFGFDEPMTNDHGDVAFIATFGNQVMDTTAAAMPSYVPPRPGAGVFAWDNDEERLKAVAVTGQETEVGKLPSGMHDFDGPTLNNADQIAFAVRNIMGGCATSALFLGNVENDELKVLVKQGDYAPGGGTFDLFDDLSLNQDGDVAFIASVVENAPAPAQVVDNKWGVFLKKAYEHEIQKIVRFGEELPGTYGGTLCGQVDGPWLNDKGDVLFQADCIMGGKPGLEGSIFIKRHDEYEIEPFLLIGDDVGESTVKAVHIGRPGVNNKEAALLIEPNDGGKVIATKKLAEHDCKPRICATNGQELTDTTELIVGNNAPSIAEDGTIAFAGESEEQNSTADLHAIFTCKDEKLKVIAMEGDEKPLTGKKMKHAMDLTDGFLFGELEESSNADGHVVFLDETARPTGVFLAETRKKKD